MKVELWPIARVKPYEKNPRLNDDAVDAVAASLREYGFRQPIVVDTEGIIVCGHTRWKAAQKLGLAKVPVHVAKDLTPEQIKAYRIADNKTAELAEWNFDLLTIELSELRDLDVDLGLLGFDQDELARLFDTGVQDGLTDPDDIPEPPDKAITQPGDLWILGNHRLYCGDSSKPEDVDRLLEGAAIHLCNTDPPYNVKVEPRSNNAIAAGNSSFSNKHHQKFDLERHPNKSKPTNKKMRAKDRPLANDFVSDEAFDELLAAWFGNISRVLLPGRSFFIWGGYANLGNYPPFLKSSGVNKGTFYFSTAGRSCSIIASDVWYGVTSNVVVRLFKGDILFFYSEVGHAVHDTMCVRLHQLKRFVFAADHRRFWHAEHALPGLDLAWCRCRSCSA